MADRPISRQSIDTILEKELDSSYEEEETDNSSQSDHDKKVDDISENKNNRKKRCRDKLYFKIYFRERKKFGIPPKHMHQEVEYLCPI